MTEKDLKNALLQEAVQGKLVPQIASEGNARDLLEEIRKEKSKLVKEGKLKKEKPLPELTEEEIPFDIPENWCWCRGSELFNIRSASRIHQSDWVTHGIPFLRGRELVQLSQNGKLDKPEIFITEDFYNELIKKSGIPQKDDILVSAVGTLGRCYIVKETDRFYYKDAYILCYENFNKLYAPFYKIIIESPYYQAKIREDSQATTVAQFTIIKAKTIPFPLPPIKEQKRIVAAIEKFMPLIEEYGKKETELKALNEQIGTLTKKAILQEAVQGKLVPQIAAEGNAKNLLEEIKKEKAKLIKEGKIKKEKLLTEITEDEIPFDIPENWCWCRLGEIIRVLGGVSYDKKDVTKTGYRILRGGNIQQMKILLDETDVFLPEKYRDEDKLIRKGDILIVASTGSKAVIGKAGFVDLDVSDIMIGAFLRICRPYSLDMAGYLRCLFESDFYRKHIRDLAQGTNINNVKESYITEFVIPLPPLAEQKRIVAAIEKMLPLCEKLGE